MYDAAEMLERHAAALKVLAERALALACAVQERALAAETPAEMAELSLAFHRISRSTRQCLALEAKLVRDAERAARDAAAEAARESQGQTRFRKDRLRQVLRQMITDQGGTMRVPDEDADDDDEEAEIEVWDETTVGRMRRLETLLDREELDGRLAGGSVTEQIERLRADLGMAEAALDADAGEGRAAETQGSPAWPPTGPPFAPGEGGFPAAGPPNSS